MGHVAHDNSNIYLHIWAAYWATLTVKHFRRIPRSFYVVTFIGANKGSLMLQFIAELISIFVA